MSDYAGRKTRARHSEAKEAWRAALRLYWKSQIEDGSFHREGKAGLFAYQEGKAGRFTYKSNPGAPACIGLAELDRLLSDRSQ